MDISLLEFQMRQNFPEARDRYLDVVRYDPKLNRYYVAMRGEDRPGVAEWCVELDEHSLCPAELSGEFHESEFPESVYRNEARSKKLSQNPPKDPTSGCIN